MLISGKPKITIATIWLLRVAIHKQAKRRRRENDGFNRTTQKVSFFQTTGWQVNDDICLLNLFWFLVLKCLDVGPYFYFDNFRIVKDAYNHD